jgi:hypothetical protein
MRVAPDVYRLYIVHTCNNQLDSPEALIPNLCTSTDPSLYTGPRGNDEGYGQREAWQARYRY